MSIAFTSFLTNAFIQANEGTMSSLDFLNNIINPAREQFGENPARN